MVQFYNNLKTLVFLGLLSALIIMVGGVIGGEQGMLIGLVFAGIMNFGSYYFSDKIALAAMQATEVGPDHPLYRIVQPLAARAGLPMPRVYISAQMAPNAFATGRNPHHAAVCATEGLLQMLSPDQIAGVMSHELAHVKHRDILITTIAATAAGAITFLAHNMYWFGLGDRRDRRGGGMEIIELLAVMILAPIAAVLIQAAISRSREFNADAGGAEICGNPMYLATALERLESANRQIPTDVNPAFNAMFISEPLNPMAAMARLFRSHPPLEARLVNLIGREHV